MATYKSKYTGAQIDEAVGIALLKDAATLGGKKPEGYAEAEHTHVASEIGAATTMNYSATIGTSWTGTAAPYTQTIAIEGILETDYPIADVILPASADEATAVIGNWQNIYKIATAEGSVTVYAMNKTTAAMNVLFKVIR